MAEGAGLSLSAFAMFDTQTDPTSIGPRWRKWMVRFENRITAMNLTDPERKLALLLDYAGDDVHDDFLTLTVPAAGGNDPPGNDIYHRSITALNNHYAPQVQREYEIFSFRTAKQEESESLDQFVTRLRKLGATCDFANLSAEIKSQVIQRCKSLRLRTKGLSDLTMTLDDLIKTGNAMDRAVVYAQSIEGNTEMSVITNLQPASSPNKIINEPTAMIISENKNPAIQETNRLILSVVIAADPIHTKEAVSPAPRSSSVVTTAELWDTTRSCVESHKQTAMVKIGVKAVVEVAVVDMADLAVYITSYTILM